MYVLRCAVGDAKSPRLVDYVARSVMKVPATYGSNGFGLLALPACALSSYEMNVLVFRVLCLRF